jgi:hypothetical protein
MSTMKDPVEDPTNEQPLNEQIRRRNMQCGFRESGEEIEFLFLFFFSGDAQRSGAKDER